MASQSQAYAGWQQQIASFKLQILALKDKFDELGSQIRPQVLGTLAIANVTNTYNHQELLAQLKALRMVLNTNEEPKSRDYEYRATAEGSPVRALVKEYVQDDPDPDLRVMSWMLKDIRYLNRNKCINRDIKRDNYRNGVLVDFGCAWTEPHCLIRLASKERVETWKMTDMVQFDTMASQQGFGDAIHAMPNWEYRQKLRSEAEDRRDDGIQTGESSSVSSSLVQRGYD